MIYGPIVGSMTLRTRHTVSVTKEPKTITPNELTGDILYIVQHN